MTLAAKVTKKVKDGLQERSPKAQRTRASLLRTAIDIIGDKGYSATTVDEIADKAGVSKGVLYYHFKSKAEMATAIFEEELGSFVVDLESLGGKTESSIEALRNMATCFASMVDTNRQFAKFFLSEMWREDRVWKDSTKACERRMRDAISVQIKRGQSEGELRSDLDPDFIATAFMGMCLSLSLDWVTYHPKQSKEGFVAKLTDFARYGVAV